MDQGSQALLYPQKTKTKHYLGDEFNSPQRLFSQSRNQAGSNSTSKGHFGALEFVRIMKRKNKKRGGKFNKRSNSLAHKNQPYSKPILAKPLILKQNQG